MRNGKLQDSIKSLHSRKFIKMVLNLVWIDNEYTVCKYLLVVYFESSIVGYGEIYPQSPRAPTFPSPSELRY
jgi:hypothetical protein